MKSKRFALPFALVFLLSVLATPIPAFAVPEKTVASETTMTTKADNSAWLAMKEAAKPFQATIRANDKAFKALREELGTEVAAARLRIEDFLSASITSDELVRTEGQLVELRSITALVQADIGSLGEEMTLLRGRKTDLDLPGMILCFENAIAIQEGRIQMLTDALALVKTITP